MFSLPTSPGKQLQMSGGMHWGPAFVGASFFLPSCAWHLSLSKSAIVLPNLFVSLDLVTSILFHLLIALALVHGSQKPHQQRELRERDPRISSLRSSFSKPLPEVAPFWLDPTLCDPLSPQETRLEATQHMSSSQIEVRAQSFHTGSVGRYNWE